MDTPPYSDVSAQFSPNHHPNHVNPDPHSLPGPSAVAHPHAPNGSASASASGSGNGPVSADLRSLYSSSLSALDTTPPPTLREILTAYKQKGDGDRDMLLAMLNAKTAEDQVRCRFISDALCFVYFAHMSPRPSVLPLSLLFDAPYLKLVIKRQSHSTVRTRTHK